MQEVIQRKKKATKRTNRLNEHTNWIEIILLDNLEMGLPATTCTKLLDLLMGNVKSRYVNSN